MKFAILFTILFCNISTGAELSSIFVQDVEKQSPEAKSIAENLRALKENKPAKKDYGELLVDIKKVRAKKDTSLLALMQLQIHRGYILSNTYGFTRPDFTKSYFQLLKQFDNKAKKAYTDKNLSSYSKFLIAKNQYWLFPDQKRANKLKLAFKHFKLLAQNKEIWTEGNYYTLFNEMRDLIDPKLDYFHFKKFAGQIHKEVLAISKLATIPHWFKSWSIGYFHLQHVCTLRGLMTYKMPPKSFENAEKHLSHAFRLRPKGYVGASLYSLYMRNYDEEKNEIHNVEKLENLLEELDKVDEHYPRDYAGEFRGHLGRFFDKQRNSILSKINNTKLRYSLLYFLQFQLQQYVSFQKRRKVAGFAYAEELNPRDYVREKFDMDALKATIHSFYKLPPETQIGLFGERSYVNGFAFPYFFLIDENKIAIAIFKKNPDILNNYFIKSLDIHEYQIGFSHAVTGPAGKLIENIRMLYRDPYKLTVNDPKKLKEMIREVEDAKAITEDERANRFFDYYLSFLNMEKQFHEVGHISPKADKDFTMFFKKGRGFSFVNNKINTNSNVYSAPKLFLKSPFTGAISIEMEINYKKLTQKERNIFPFGLFVQHGNTEHYAWYDPIKQKAGFTKQSRYLDMKTYYNDTNSVDAKFGKRAKLELILKDNKAVFIINSKEVLKKDFSYDIGLVGFGVPNGAYDIADMELTNFKIKKLK